MTHNKSMRTLCALPLAFLTLIQKLLKIKFWWITFIEILWKATIFFVDLLSNLLNFCSWIYIYYIKNIKQLTNKSKPKKLIKYHINQQIIVPVNGYSVMLWKINSVSTTLINIYSVITTIILSIAMVAIMWLQTLNSNQQ